MAEVQVLDPGSSKILAREVHLVFPCSKTQKINFLCVLKQFSQSTKKFCYYLGAIWFLKENKKSNYKNGKSSGTTWCAFNMRKMN